MDGPQAIEFQRAALLRLLEALFALVDLAPGRASVARLPKLVRCQIARVLLPAESATRRLVLYVSRRMALPVAVARNGAARKPSAKKRAALRRAPVFWLFDRWPHYPELSVPGKRVPRGPDPRIWLFDGFDHLRNPARPEKVQRDPDDAVRLTRRMQALHRALSDMSAQALRLKRALEKRAEAPPGPGRYGPMRTGNPPGHRQNRTHEVDELLWVCHRLAWQDTGPPAPP